MYRIANMFRDLAWVLVAIPHLFRKTPAFIRRNQRDEILKLSPTRPPNSLIRNLVKIRFRKYGKLITSKSHLTPSPTEHHLYVNGMMTSFALATYQRDVLAEAIDTQVELCYNETRGFLFDLLESVLDRTFDTKLPMVRDVQYHLSRLLRTSNKQIYIHAHSQGGIIALLALQHLYDKHDKDEALKLLSRITVITYGSGSDPVRISNCASKCFKHVAIVNEHDFVARIGGLRETNSKNTIVRKRVGVHSFTHGYVGGIILDKKQGKLFSKTLNDIFK